NRQEQAVVAPGAGRVAGCSAHAVDARRTGAFAAAPLAGAQPPPHDGDRLSRKRLHQQHVHSSHNAPLHATQPLLCNNNNDVAFPARNPPLPPRRVKHDVVVDAAAPLPTAQSSQLNVFHNHTSVHTGTAAPLVENTAVVRSASDLPHMATLPKVPSRPRTNPYNTRNRASKMT
ncbi:hypothetical protein AAVH_37235, partial [Aphelenchoides avenae]